eukprot:4734172-Pyramimonas_sp.AAC.1
MAMMVIGMRSALYPSAPGLLFGVAPIHQASICMGAVLCARTSEAQGFEPSAGLLHLGRQSSKLEFLVVRHR